MPRHRFTQADVAAMAGVSQSTVSFVLNGSAPAGVRISEETRSRVLDAIRITGYSANPVAQRLAGGRNQILGVFTYEATFPRGGQDFYGAFLVGIEHAAEQLGVDMLLFTSARVVDGRRQLARDGWQRLGIADGCLLLGQHEDQGELQHLLDTNYPFVFVGKRASEGRVLPYVGADYVAATARQVERLVAAGHRRIGYAGLQGSDQSTLDRVEGYRQAMRAHGLPLRFVDVHDVAVGAEEIAERRLTGILVAPDNAPDELAEALEARGLHVPRDISMLLLGQPIHQSRGSRRWSGFTVPREEMGARALVLLSRIVERERGGGRGPSATALDDADLHQILDCPEADGESLAPAPASIRTETEGPIRDRS
ncbi:LacI family transcriptional regulator [Microbacterium aerolatum]|uniref:LacI family transcriptional regulator n=1 Tax=Microbacterium aerolatum TaxID=153731 RepID=A0A511ABZ9_9MICO|nr:LacI family DNA-binding transcriptional regulator [Microbacterium aerolatum]GEK85602.1 LacI family transcriptional regulator [Microbacterium aerolatum]GGB21826.1 LacI family transcriptional regulator [Microbacterium aerolatum]